jgi:nucleoside-triphosphatase THEP1
MGRAVLLTGRPGVGKTTVIRECLAALPGRCGGFYTQEMRARGRRLGFEIVTMEGARAILARAGVGGLPRVGKYGVYVENVDRVAVPSVQRAVAEADYVVIDEIGKMELFSETFRAAVLSAVNSPKAVLGTVMQRAHPWVDALKSMPQVVVVPVTLQNRDSLVERIAQLLSPARHDTLARLPKK